MELANQPDIIMKHINKSLKSKREAELRKSITSEELIASLMKKDYMHLQLLIFAYLGFLNDIKLPNTKKKILLSIIFKTEGFENLRKMLSHINDYKTKENLEIIRDLFEELQLSEPLEKVKNDLLKKN